MYLRTVLELEEEGVTALRARLSERLGLSAPAVSEGVARLEQAGFAVLGADRTITLTELGRERAEHVMRKHRLAERLLVDVLGLEREHVHEEACRWEHVISDRVEAKLLEFLGNPTTSPYGNPIPGSAPDGHEPVSLADAAEGAVTIRYFSEHLQRDHDVIQQLDAGRIWSGTTVEVARGPGSVTLEHDGEQVELDAEEAKLVFVTPA
ncbi:iron dependent repressor, metal binding and dimerization domain protein [Nitriliruptor alkaliphilus]|uniref:iron dependent repressor, metal binding and dimerization domain protein n=1 Tax=Nitriliruptor alkaliphilus TaxID=427918 RepID=UPI0006986E2A